MATYEADSAAQRAPIVRELAVPALVAAAAGVFWSAERALEGRVALALVLALAAAGLLLGALLGPLARRAGVLAVALAHGRPGPLLRAVIGPLARLVDREPSSATLAATALVAFGVAPAFVSQVLSGDGASVAPATAAATVAVAAAVVFAGARRTRRSRSSSSRLHDTASDSA